MTKSRLSGADWMLHPIRASCHIIWSNLWLILIFSPSSYFIPWSWFDDETHSNGIGKDCCRGRYVRPPRNPPPPALRGALFVLEDADGSIAVARIAYLSSDVVLSVQPALGTDSDFSKHLHSYSASRLPGLVTKEAPEVGL